MIKVDGLRVYYRTLRGDVRALDDVSFAVADGEIMGLELVGLGEEVLFRYPIELSGGMKQRTVMVLSTLLNPSLLVADEVTSALDVSSQRALAAMLLEFRER